MSPMGPDPMWVQRRLDPELRAYPWKPVPLGALSPVSVAFHTRLQASCGQELPLTQPWAPRGWHSRWCQTCFQWHETLLDMGKHVRNSRKKQNGTGSGVPCVQQRARTQGSGAGSLCAVWGSILAPAWPTPGSWLLNKDAKLQKVSASLVATPALQISNTKLYGFFLHILARGLPGGKEQPACPATMKALLVSHACPEEPWPLHRPSPHWEPWQRLKPHHCPLCPYRLKRVVLMEGLPAHPASVSRKLFQGTEATERLWTAPFSGWSANGLTFKNRERSPLGEWNAGEKSQGVGRRHQWSESKQAGLRQNQKTGRWARCCSWSMRRTVSDQALLGEALCPWVMCIKVWAASPMVRKNQFTNEKSTKL